MPGLLERAALIGQTRLSGAPQQPHGWIILDKPVGLGSTQAVAAVKRNLREAGVFERWGKLKVGHGGTLDPLASGVLPIAFGEATKLAGRMLDASKEYEFTLAFGAETDTLDLEGAVIAQSPQRPTRTEVEAILPRFTGAIGQVPPAYSALRVAGERAYDRARAGKAVELEARAVTILSLAVGHAETVSASLAPARGPAREDGWTLKPVQRDEALASVTLAVSVSKGTYIRSLARDIALALGTRGHVAYLRRTRAGPFDLSHAISLDKLNEIGKGARPRNAILTDAILPLEAALDDIPALDLGPEQARAVRQGRILTGLPQDDGLYWARQGRVPVALMELSGGTVRIVRGFNLPDVAE